MCDLALSVTPLDYQYVPMNLKTADYDKQAVLSDPFNIKYVGKQTQDICDHVFSNDGWLVRLFKPEFITYDMMKEIAKDKYKLQYYYVSFVDPPEDVSIEYVTLYPRRFKNVKKQTEAINIVAVRGSIVNLRDVVDQTEAVCFAALEKSWQAIKHIRKENLTDEIAGKAASINPKARHYF